MKKPAVVKKAVRTILFLVPLAVLGNVIYVLISSGDSGYAALLHLPFQWLFLAVFLSLAPWLIAVLRLALWSRFFDLQLGLKSLLEAVLANDIAAVATPTAVGGGYAKLGLLVFYGARPGVAASIMVIGSVEDYAFFAIAVPILWMLYPPATINIPAIMQKVIPSGHALPSILMITAIGALSMWLLVFRLPASRRLLGRLGSSRWWQKKLLRPVKKLFDDFCGAFRLISQGGKRYFAANTLLAGVQWGMRYSIFTALAYGFGLEPHPVKFFLLQWFLFSLLNVVPTPGAIGGAELGFALIFKGVVPGEILAIAGGAWRFITTYLQLMAAAALMLLLEKPRFLPHRKITSGRHTAVQMIPTAELRSSQLRTATRCYEKSPEASLADKTGNEG